MRCLLSSSPAERIFLKSSASTSTSTVSSTPPQPASAHTIARSTSPTAPPYSPITPTYRQQQHRIGSIASIGSPRYQVHPTIQTATAPNTVNGSSNNVRSSSSELPQVPRASEPIDLASNPDALALRATLTILQMQRQRAIEDMQTLDRQRAIAESHPEAFQRSLLTGEIKTRAQQHSTLLSIGSDGEGCGLLDRGGISLESPQIMNEPEIRNRVVEDVDLAMGETKEEKQEKHVDLPAAEVVDKSTDQDERTIGTAATINPLADFGVIPSPQEVVRCPPIEWAQYHVVGDVLDRMHAERQKKPDGENDYLLVAPYRPWTDKLGNPGKTRKLG